MSDVKQTDNEVGGDMAGRDINKTVNVLPPRNPSRLKALQIQFEEDCKNKPELKQFIEAIQHFLATVDDTEIIGLSEKLTKGGRLDEVKVAESCKESFYKLLTKNQFSPAAQQIYTILLGGIYNSFMAYVAPLIEKKEEKATINSTLYEKVLLPLQEQINDEGLHVNPHELRGMLYFLTGNCHIRWH